MGGARRWLAFALVTAGFVQGTIRGDVVTSTWLGGAGSWNTASNWSGGVVPNNFGVTTFDVRIDAGNAVNSTVTLQSTPMITIDALTIDAGDTLNGRLTVNGSLIVNGTLQAGMLLLGTNPVITGSGTIALNNSFSTFNLIRQASGDLTIDSGITISGGYGDEYYFNVHTVIGAATASLNNLGRIRAGGAGVSDSMIIVAGSSINNLGILDESGPGAILGIDTNFSFATIGALDYSRGSLMIFGTLDNTGLNLQVDNAHGGFILASSGTAYGGNNPGRIGTVRGGTVTTVDGKSLRVPPGRLGRLDGVTLNGSASVAGRLEVPTGQTFRGNADIEVVAYNIEDIGVLRAQTGPTVIETGMLIHGGHGPLVNDSYGAIGNSGATITNAGTIRADSGLRFALLGNSLINSGTLWADSGGTLAPLGTTIFSSGTLRVSAGGVINVPDGDVFFQAGASFVVDGGGSMSLNYEGLGLIYGGELRLVPGNSLIVLPRLGGGAYSNFTIVDCEYGRSGTFSSVTPGITVEYFPKSIVISGTPIIPEPACSATVAVAAWLAWRRRIDV